MFNEQIVHKAMFTHTNPRLARERSNGPEDFFLLQRTGFASEYLR